MVRRSIILVAAFASLSLAAQPLRVSTPQPISAIRSGIPSGSVQFPLIASNGTSFLMSWADDRFLAGMGNQAFASGLLTRVDANGLSPFSSVHRLMIAPFETVRGRAARHP